MNNNLNTKSIAVVRFQVPGFHYWEGATGDRSYLRANHRHVFHVEVKLSLNHQERDVEFHDLKDFCSAEFPGGEMGGQSCEQMAQGLLTAVNERYPGRSVQVGVFEDEECGAEVSLC
jgi:hypothetical protein